MARIVCILSSVSGHLGAPTFNLGWPEYRCCGHGRANAPLLRLILRAGALRLWGGRGAPSQHRLPHPGTDLPRSLLAVVVEHRSFRRGGRGLACAQESLSCLGDSHLLEIFIEMELIFKFHFINKNHKRRKLNGWCFRSSLPFYWTGQVLAICCLRASLGGSPGLPGPSHSP